MAFNITAFLSHAVATASLCLSVAIVAIGVYGIYNAFLHPLRKFPGPKLWAAYRLPFAIRTFQGLLPFKVHEFHKRYGPIVRIAPNELAFIDGQAWEDLQGLLPDRTQNAKDLDAYTPKMTGYEKSIIMANDAQHARLRRIYGPAFTPKAVEEQSGMLLKYANLFVTSLKRAIASNPVQDMSAWCNYATFDLTGEFAFDEPFHCLEDGGKDHFFVKTVSHGTTAGQKIMQLERYGIFSMIKPFLGKSAMQAKFDMDDYTAELVERRREKGYVPGKTDVLNYLLQNKVENNRLSREELNNNGVVLVVAGSETTATLLSGVLYNLSRNAGACQRVTQEVRTAFKSDDEVTVKSVNDLTYMLAVLSESMRIFSPSPFGFPRIITTPGGQAIAGHHVPYKTHCAVHHYAAYHSPDNFARPDDFLPERWLADAPLEFKNDKRKVLEPFHVGPRGCLGKNLAYAEMRLLLAKLLYHFDFEMADPSDRWAESLHGYAVWERTPLMIRLKAVQEHP